MSTTINMASIYHGKPALSAVEGTRDLPNYWEIKKIG